MSIGAATSGVGSLLVAENSDTAGIGTLITGGGLFVIGGIIALVGVAVRSSSSDDALIAPPKVAVAPWIRANQAGLRLAF
jgi:hypothetical protein